MKHPNIQLEKNGNPNNRAKFQQITMILSMRRYSWSSHSSIIVEKLLCTGIQNRPGHTAVKSMVHPRKGSKRRKARWSSNWSFKISNDQIFSLFEAVPTHLASTSCAARGWEETAWDKKKSKHPPIWVLLQDQWHQSCCWTAPFWERNALLVEARFGWFEWKRWP